MSAASVITQIGTVIAALTPSPTTPVFEESSYRRPLNTEGKGNIERLFQVVWAGNAYDTEAEGVFGEVKAWSREKFFIDIGYQKNHQHGGGGSSGLDGRASTDIKQIEQALKKKANYHSSVVGPPTEVSSSIESETTQVRIYRIVIDYLIEEPIP